MARNAGRGAGFTEYVTARVTELRRVAYLLCRDCIALVIWSRTRSPGLYVRPLDHPPIG